MNCPGEFLSPPRAARQRTALTPVRAGTRFAPRPLVLALATASLLVSGLPQPARAQGLPTGPSVVSGQASVVVNGPNMTVTNSAGSILNWQSFSIGQPNAVHFQQPDASSQVLNRVTGSDPSAILGGLSSNGKVWLLNPNGVLFGQGARVDVGGLVASTLNLNNSDWLAGNYHFQAEDRPAGIVNQGALRSSLGGRIALLGGEVHNQGLIDAPGGQVLLAAGRSIDLVDTGSPHLRLRVTAPEGEALNLGTLAAAGGRVDVHAAMVNQQGIVRAGSVGTNAAGEVVLRAAQQLNLAAGSLTSASAEGSGAGGRIVLDSHASTAGGQGGTAAGGGGGSTLVEGSVLATSAAGHGGHVQLLGRQVGVLGQALVDVSGASGGGELLVGGGQQGRDSRVPNAQAVYIGAGVRLVADASSQGNGGRVIVWSDAATRAYGSFSARGGPQGGNGGFIETSGGWLDARPASVNASAPAGQAGQWLLDPYNIQIVQPSAGSEAPGLPGPNFTSGSDDAVVYTTDIEAALNAGSNVAITTGAGGTQAGDITMRAASVTVSPNARVSLAMAAQGEIRLTDASITSNGAPLDINLQAGLGGQGPLSLSNSTLASADGSISLSGVQTLAADTPAVYLFNNSALQAGNGGVLLSGDASRSPQAGGIEIDASAITGGTVSLQGLSTNTSTPSWAAVDIHNGSTVLASQGLSITGGSQGGAGVIISNSTLVLDPTESENTDAPARLQISGQTATPNAAAVLITGSSTEQQSGVVAAGTASLDISARNDGFNAEGVTGLGTQFALIATDTGALTTQSRQTRFNTTALLSQGQVFVGSDDLELGAGSSITSTRAGQAITLAGFTAANANRVSIAADASLGTTADGHWRVYAGAPDQVQINNGQLPAFKQYNARSGEANPLTPATGNGLLFSVAPVASLTGNAFQKVYDGGVAAGPINTAAVTTTGLLGTDQVDFSTVSGAQYADKNAGNNKAVSINTGALGFTDSGGVPVLGYGVDNQLQGNISPKALVVGGISVDTKTYDATTAATLRVGSVTGFVGSENLNILSIGGNFDTKDAGSNKPVTVQPSQIVALPQNGFRPGNYSLTFQDGPTPQQPPVVSGTILPKDLLASGISVDTKTYDGTTAATVRVASVTGFVGSENLNILGIGGSFNTKDTGTDKPVTVLPSQIAAVPQNGFRPGNYTLLFDGGPTPQQPPELRGSITPKPVQLSGVSASNKVYDGSPLAQLGGGQLAGLVGSETLLFNTTGRFADSNVGQDKVVQVTATLADGSNGGLAGNSRLSPADSSTSASITPATLAYVADPASGFAGRTVPPLSGTVTGFVATDTQASATTGELRFTTPATAASPAGSYPVDGAGLAAANYRFVQAPGNATALTLASARPQPDSPAVSAESASFTGLSNSLAAVALPSQATSPTEGRVLDVMPAMRDGGSGDTTSFGSLSVSRMSQSEILAVLAARDRYKKALFAESIRRLEQDPSLSDLSPCSSAEQLATGTCLITPAISQALQAAGPDRLAAAPAPATPITPAVPAGTQPTAAAAAATPAPTAAPPSSTASRIASFTKRRVLSASLPQIERKIALVIGVSDYRDKRIPQLKNSVKDAVAVADLLQGPLGYETLVLQDATRNDVVSALNALALTTSPKDSVVIYYAGHGELIESTRLGYWQLADSEASSPQTWLSNADISRLVAQISASQVALISDSCYSGSLVDERIRAGGQLDPNAALARKTVVVMSSGGNEPVFDEGKQGHSPFAYNLMDNLKKVSSWQAGGNLFERVRFAVARELPQRPLYGSAAAAGHQTGGDYLFEQRELDARP